MQNTFEKNCLARRGNAAAEKYGLGFDLIKGANIAGFEKVVEAMISQGIYL